jgi:hypothetical protein
VASQGANSPGTVANDATVSGVAWVNPGNAATRDDVYATHTASASVSTSEYLKATNFGFSIPSGATIDGILVEIERKAATNSAFIFIRDRYVHIVKADGTFGATNRGDTVTKWSITEAYFSYGSSSDVWGETWDAGKINDVDFGVALAIQGVAGTANVASVDHIRITVYYTAAAGPALLKTVNGLAVASVKTLRSGLAIASGKTFNSLA